MPFGQVCAAAAAPAINNPDFSVCVGAHLFKVGQAVDFFESMRLQHEGEVCVWVYICEAFCVFLFFLCNKLIVEVGQCYIRNACQGAVWPHQPMCVSVSLRSSSHCRLASDAKKIVSPMGNSKLQ